MSALGGKRTLRAVICDTLTHHRVQCVLLRQSLIESFTGFNIQARNPLFAALGSSLISFVRFHILGSLTEVERP